MPEKPKVVLDACVLVPQGLCDLLLRLAEEPSLYQPIISDQVLEECRRTLTMKLPRKWPVNLADKWVAEIRRSFPIGDHRDEIQNSRALLNHPKDRHVLATAISSEAKLIATFNLKDFSKPALDPWGVKAIHPEELLHLLLHLDHGAFEDKIHAMSLTRSTSHALRAVKKYSPRIATELDIDDAVEESADAFAYSYQKQSANRTAQLAEASNRHPLSASTLALG
jgi:predicted nucleic acid-binding protein